MSNNDEVNQTLEEHSLYELKKMFPINFQRRKIRNLRRLKVIELSDDEKE